MTYTRQEAPTPVPDVVIQAIHDAFPKSAERVIREMRWSSIDGCWLVALHGCTVGIELDGYIHS